MLGKMVKEDERIIEAIAKDLCIKAGLDPDEITYGPDAIVDMQCEGWPAWEYFYEQAAKMWAQSDTNS